MNTTAKKVVDGLAAALRARFGRTADVTVHVAPDPARAVELLVGGKPNGFAVVVFYGGDDPDAGGAEVYGDTSVRARLSVGVSAHPGLSAQGSRDAPDVLAFADKVRAAVLAADVPDLLGGIDYAGMSYASASDGTLLHGYALEFRATYAFEIDETTE